MNANIVYNSNDHYTVWKRKLYYNVQIKLKFHFNFKNGIAFFKFLLINMYGKL